MTGTAVALILCSAFIHAGWNLRAKRAGGGGAVCVGRFTAWATAILWPVAVYVWFVQSPDIGWVGFGFMCGTAVLHLLYFIVLQRGYQVGDLSLVYPLARGTGPALSTIGAVLILNERPSAGTVLGLILVVGGVLLLTWQSGPRESDQNRKSAIVWGVLCGICISTYSVWDKYAVSEVDVPPILLELFTGLAICLMLTPHAMARKDEVRRVWREHRREVLAVAMLAPLSYILILTAMSFTPLSSVAPAREISILIGAIFGARFLGETHTTRRIIAAGLMVCGVVFLAVS
ncbi:MAG: EamA family transporter [Planctomycetes bacterium]|nr:EamA family transporter [Planctomycetota bacterium]